MKGTDEKRQVFQADWSGKNEQPEEIAYQLRPIREKVNTIYWKPSNVKKTCKAGAEKGGDPFKVLLHFFLSTKVNLESSQ